MNATRTQLRVYNRLQDIGSTMTIPIAGGTTTLKAMVLESPDTLPTRFRQDFRELPQHDSVYFLVGIPPEAARDTNGNPVDGSGNPLDSTAYPSPEMTRSDYIRSLLPEGREFTCNKIRYTAHKEVPLVISDVNLYLLYICSPR